jgi:hypothetical protein
LLNLGQALELLIDNTPTYGYVRYVYYYQGKVPQRLKTPPSPISTAPS